MEESFYRLPGPENLRVALVSDLHGRPFGAVMSSLRARKPALICVAGAVVTYIYLSIVSKRVFPKYPDEAFLSLYGMQTGVVPDEMGGWVVTL